MYLLYKVNVLPFVWVIYGEDINTNKTCKAVNLEISGDVHLGSVI
jgi:hypothetical protein